MNDPHAPPTAPVQQPPTPPAEKTPLWEDFVDIYTSPAAVFERRRSSGFAIPLLLVTVLLAVLVFAIMPLLDPVVSAEMDRQAQRVAAQNPQVNVEQARTQMERFSGITPFFLLFAVPLGALITGSLLWLAGKAVEARQPYRAALMVAAYAQFPRVIEQITYGAQGALLDISNFVARSQLSVGPARFLDPLESSPLLLALLMRLDVFTLWVTVLLVIGLAVTGGIPRGRAAIAGVLVWLVGSLPVVWTAFNQ